MVVRLPSKQDTRVRFPLPAPLQKAALEHRFLISNLAIKI